MTPIEAATAALRNMPLNISSTRRGDNGLRNAEEVARKVVSEYLKALLDDPATVEEIAIAVGAYAESLPDTSSTKLMLRSQRVGVAQATLSTLKKLTEQQP